MGHQARSRGRAETACRPAAPAARDHVIHHPRRTIARPRASPECRHDLRRRDDRGADRAVDGVCEGAARRADHRRRHALQRSSNRRDRRRALPRGVSGTRRRPAASRYQSAQRDAGRRRTRRPDGFRNGTGTPERFDAPIWRAPHSTWPPRSLPGTGDRPERHLQCWRPALPPAHALLSRAGRSVPTSDWPTRECPGSLRTARPDPASLVRSSTGRSTHSPRAATKARQLSRPSCWRMDLVRLRIAGWLDSRRPG